MLKFVHNFLFCCFDQECLVAKPAEQIAWDISFF